MDIFCATLVDSALLYHNLLNVYHFRFLICMIGVGEESFMVLAVWLVVGRNHRILVFWSVANLSVVRKGFIPLDLVCVGRMQSAWMILGSLRPLHPF